MKLIARHLTADLFGCKNKKITDIDLIKQELSDLLATEQYEVISLSTYSLSPDHYLVAGVLKQGHFTMHIYTGLRYVALDIFLCEPEADPDQIAIAMRHLLKPDKIKSTMLKRGSFGTPKDVRPNIKTHVAPLRKIHNTGAKVVRILARKNRS